MFADLKSKLILEYCVDAGSLEARLLGTLSVPASLLLVRLVCSGR
jgi:hypothetical protein